MTYRRPPNSDYFSPESIEHYKKVWEKTHEKYPEREVYRSFESPDPVNINGSWGTLTKDGFIPDSTEND